MLYLRSLTDYKLIPNDYVLIMLDGRSFSSTIKRYFKKPFDDTFINIMNETALYLCNNVQGCKFAYVQSDEISLMYGYCVKKMVRKTSKNYQKFHKNDIKIEKFLTFNKRHIKFLNFLIVNKL